MAYNCLVSEGSAEILRVEFGPTRPQMALTVAESEHTLGGSPDPERGDLVRNNLVVADYGPRFVGMVARTSDSLVCVAAPSYEHEPKVRAVMRELVEREGGNCELCLNCPIGRLKG